MTRLMHRPAQPWRRAPRGFTLIEVILVIAITGIIGGIVAVFIKLPVQSYVDSAARAELTDTADTALRRIARDVRLALPNSIRYNSAKTAVEFLPTKTGGRYLAGEDGQDTTLYPVLDFVDATKLTFTVVGAMPSGPLAISPTTDSIVVYNLGPGFDSADAYTKGNVAAVSAVSGNKVTLASNPFAAAATAMSSPGRRFQVITKPVMYLCDPGTKTIQRISNYEITKDMPTAAPSGATSAVLASNVSACMFQYESVANTHSALLGISITLKRPNSTDAVTLSHQVHVDNVP